MNNDLKNMTKLENALNLIKDGVIAVKNNIITYVNISLCGIVDYDSPEDLIGKPASIIMLDTKKLDQIEGLQKAKNKHIDDGSQIELLSKKREVIPCKVKWLASDSEIIVVVENERNFIESKMKEIEYKRTLTLINGAASRFLKMNNQEDVYDYTVSLIREIIPFSSVIITKYSPSDKSTQIEYSRDFNKNIKTLLKISGINLKSKRFKIPDDIKEKLDSGKLTVVNGGIYELTFGTVPQFISTAMGKILNLDKIYSIGVTSENQLAGNVIIITKKKYPLVNPELIENIICLMASTLKRCHLESILSEKEKLYNKIIDITPDPIIICSSDLTIRYISEKTLYELGYTEKTEIIGKKAVDFIHPASRMGTFTFYKRVLTGDIHNLHCKLIKSDTSIFNCEVNITVTGTANSTKQEFIFALHDINDRIVYEKELENARNKAIESDELKSAFLSNISHEIRTPINSISGFAKLLRDQDLIESDRMEFLDIIIKCSGDLLNQINNIIEISKLQINDIVIEKTEFTTDELYSELDIYYKEQFTSSLKRGVTFSVAKIDNKTIYTDRNKLKQIIINMLDNAVKFTEKGTISIGHETDGEYITFFVKDTGSGISDENKRFIFDIFRQTNFALTRKYKGSGLGLTICKKTAELIGGVITYESKEGFGSTFKITVPISNKNYRTEAHPGSKYHSFYKILLVNRDKMLADYLTLILNEAGYNTISVSSGKETLSILQKDHEISLVILDIDDSENGGYETAKIIRETRPEVMIIAESSDMENSPEKIKAHGTLLDGIIIKPLTKEKFESAISKFM